MFPNKPLHEPVATVVNGHTFTVDTRYVLKDSRILGKGSFGVVTTAYDSIRKIDMAIKRIRPYANDDWDSRHTLREIRLLKLLSPHPNVITLYELSLNEPKTELYMMMEVMDCDLHRVIQSKQPLSEKHFKCFMKQILEGIKAMHAIGVFHRDLKPGNILVSKDCQLRITDFGLARFMDESTRVGQNQLNPMTEYVVTRWYRCPELLLSPNRPYNEAIDLWSIGCILAELLRRKPLFPGKSHANQVQMIFEVLGYSSVRDLGFPVSQEAGAFLDKRCKYRKQPWEKVIPDASREALGMLEALLELNPDDRPTAAAALELPFLEGAEVLHDYSKNYLTRPTVEFFDFEAEKYSALELKGMIELEVRLSAAYAYQYERLGSAGPASLTNSPAHSATENGAMLSPTSRGSSRENSARPPVASGRTNSATSEHGGIDRSFRRMSATDVTAVDEENGPASQLATQLRNSKLEKSKDNPFRSQQQDVAPTYRGQVPVRPNSSEAAHEAAVHQGRPLRSSSATGLPQEEQYTGNGGNILSAVRASESGVPSRGRRTAPKTPSPQKMDAILQKDLNNKRRFVLEEAQRQREADAQNYHAPGVASGTVFKHPAYSKDLIAVDHSKKPATTASRWTFPSNAPAAASSSAAPAPQYNSNFSTAQQQQQAADSKKSAAAGKSSAFPSLSRIGALGSRLSGGSSNSRIPVKVPSSEQLQQMAPTQVRSSHAIQHSGSNIIQGDHYDH